ncbi:MAG: S-layer homology domain-containing protein [Kastovskya adunca ATA6-11-RM4]|nr:S-layer homology domain-containing protein [Kastovskya adunca ATA6-11-RM4]
MTNTPPEPPSRLGFDELVGVVVAFATIGAILFISLRPVPRGIGGFFDPLDGAARPDVDRPTRAEQLEAALGGDPPRRDRLEAADPVRRTAPVPGAIVPVEPRRTERLTPLVPVIPVPPAQRPAETAIAPPATPEQAVQFSDVPQDFWARPYIEALAARNIVVGFGNNTFRPNSPVTRAEFAAQIEKAFGDKEITGAPQYAPNYTDVANDFWAYSPIQAATRNGFLQGYPGNAFRPTQQIPKVQALVALASGLNLQPRSAPNQILQTYQDAAQIPNYATQAVAAATEAGIVVNHPNRQQLNPNKITTRAEAAALLYQGLVQAGEAEPIDTNYVVQPQSEAAP